MNCRIASGFVSTSTSSHLRNSFRSVCLFLFLTHWTTLLLAQSGPPPSPPPEVEELAQNGLPDELPSLRPENAPRHESRLDEVPRELRGIVTNKIVKGLESRNDGLLVSGVIQLVGRADHDELELIEAKLDELGYGELELEFTSRLIGGISQNLVNVKSFRPKVARYTLTGIKRLVDAEIGEFLDHNISKDPLVLPTEWPQKEELFWDLHVWRNRFINLERLLEFAQKLEKRSQQQQDEHEKFNPNAKPEKLATLVRVSHQDLLEREAELRLAGLKDAESTLRTSADRYDRLNAAFALLLHSGELERFFKDAKNLKLYRQSLQSDVLKQCKKLLQSGRKHGNADIEKATLLRVGAHWWFRGRYGVSTLANGLLKPTAAMTSPDLMFGLFMPKARPNAIGYVDSKSSYETPGYDRRHYYTWAVELPKVRQIQSSSEEASYDHQSAGTTASTFW